MWQPWQTTAALAGALLLGTGWTADTSPAPEVAAADIARQTVATSLGIDLPAPQVVAVTPRDFPDGSLDCPEPGMLYPQVITRGFEVQVDAAGRRFDVRVAGNRGRICTRSKASGLAGKPTPAQAAEPARLDLAARLGIAPADVRIGQTRAQRPGERLPGCAETCTSATACGFVVGLEAAGRRYDYLSIAGAVKPCPAIEPR